MNLLRDEWLPVILKDGSKKVIAITDLLDDYNTNPVIELEAPRLDFKSALYQLLVGVVQVSMPPKSERAWKKLYKSPVDSSEFKEAIEKIADYFVIDSDGPAFMQDLELEGGSEKSIGALLIEAPGDQTLKYNTDLFIKRGGVESVDAYWAAAALYTLQTFAPSGGVGHRVGLRGGGPLTTMVIPADTEATLWEKLWLNVLSLEHLDRVQGDRTLEGYENIFPWLKPTKSSDTSGSPLFSSEVHPFYHFFGMPRRIRLNFGGKGVCDLTGKESDCVVSGYITKNYGNNYDGVWSHPLTPYGHDPKKPTEPPFSKKGGKINYSHWLGVVVETERVRPALVVKLASSEKRVKALDEQGGFIVWASGYDMDNMKAKGWYESTMPLFSLGDDQKKAIDKYIPTAVACASDLAKSTVKAIKEAWSNRPKDLRGDISYIASIFLNDTEEDFYALLQDIITDPTNEESIGDKLMGWAYILKVEAEKLFDTTVLAQQEDGLNMERVLKSRSRLGKAIGSVYNKLKRTNKKEA